jgi:hypothetical protein
MPQRGRIDDARDDLVECLGYTHGHLGGCSTNRHPVRVANAAHSDVGTCREYSYMAGACMHECRASAVGGTDDGDERRGEDITLSSLLPTTIFTTSGDTSSQAPLTIAGAPRTIRDSTHRILNVYHTRAGVHAQQGRTEMILCVSHEEEKRSAVNTRTEYDALRSAVIRCGDGPETFLGLQCPTNI